jgi:hypothetical protein
LSTGEVARTMTSSQRIRAHLPDTPWLGPDKLERHS